MKKIYKKLIFNIFVAEGGHVLSSNQKYFMGARITTSDKYVGSCAFRQEITTKEQNNENTRAKCYKIDTETEESEITEFLNYDQNKVTLETRYAGMWILERTITL